MLYNAYVKQKVRKVIAYRELDVSSAIRFLKENKFGIIQDETGLQLTQEELEYAKNVRPESGAGSDYTITSGDPIPESSDRELFGSTTDPTESSSDGDYQWNKQS